jgi:6-pyruvoyltetrahydropterin/6-carboxytetrahydropterin synthase
MYTISKEFHFSAGHHLRRLPEDHPCSTFHGHNYKVTVELVSNILDSVGMVFDYRRLEPIKKWIDETFDHKDLNDGQYFITNESLCNPTAENMARVIFIKCKELLPDLYRDGIKINAVTVSETDKTSARYEA